MKTFIAIVIIAMSSTVFAQDQSSPDAHPTHKESELSSRQLEMEVRQIVMERKLKDLEDQVKKQKQTIDKPAQEQNTSYRMSPRHIEVLKKDNRPIETQPSVQFPVYPIYPMNPGQWQKQ